MGSGVARVVPVTCTSGGFGMRNNADGLGGGPRRSSRGS